MTTVTVKVDSRWPRRMLRLAPKQVARAQRRAMVDGTKLLKEEMRFYPTRPDSTYIRTDALKGSWKTSVKRITRGYMGIVRSNENEAPYNIYVQDEVWQSGIHTPYWTNTVQHVAETKANKLRQIFEYRLLQEIK